MMICLESSVVKMIPKSEDILKILNGERGKKSSDRWIVHSIYVASVVERLAGAFKEKGYDTDVEKAKTLALLHDIGKISADDHGHEIKGYNYMKEKGYDIEYCNIALTHSYLNNDYLCTAGGIPKATSFRTDFVKNHEYTLYEKMVCLADLMCADEIYTIDKRLVEMVMRKGAYQTTQYHMKETYKLKKFFDDLLGYDLYELFPEVKINL